MRLIWADRDAPFPRPWAVCLAVLLAAMLCLPGCGGCRKQNEKTKAEEEAERIAKEREKKKPNFEIALPVSQPADEKLSGCRVKPGHWTSAIIEAKANKDDFVGDLSLGLVGENSRPIGLDAVPYTMSDSRGVALSKGRAKQLHGSFFVPPVVEKVSGRLRLSPRSGSYGHPEQAFSLVRMLAYQYHLVVLARTPERYAFVRSLDSIKPPRGEIEDPARDCHYWVSLVKTDREALVPDHALFWTTIAYVLWDDVEPKSLSADQQRALLDWLHWGGQLIVSGPDTLATLRDSFLADYLPAKAAGAWDLKPADFDELNDHFTLPGQAPLVPLSDWSGVQLKLSDGAQFVPGAGRLLAERRVGRGRVVVTAMRLSDRPMLAWPGFDNFFNACLLRRPARRYETNDVEENVLRWADATLSNDDPTLTCGLRYFSRDAGVSKDEFRRELGLPDPDAEAEQSQPVVSSPFSIPSHSAFIPEPPAADGLGVAAWRNFSPVANAARDALKKAACVEVPGRWFVIWIIAVYLGVLVPLNWFVFAMLGRTEWAWAAAPVIAVVGTVAVVHMARLDIGFARSETSVGVLEIEGDYGRAHLTNYTALYTSLTTRYTLSAEDAGTLVQPFPTVSQRGDFHLLTGQGLDTLVCRHAKEVELNGFSIPSNIVDFVHSEQMIPLDGKLYTARNSSGGWSLMNQTGLPLYGVGVIRKDESGAIETAWVGELGGIDNVDLTFVQPTESNPPWWPEQRNRDPVTAKPNETADPGATAEKEEINLSGLIGVAERVHDLRPGEMRMVGWTNQSLAGLKIAPSTRQMRQATLVVAHLRHAIGQPPASDVNVKRKKPTQAPLTEEVPP